MDEKLLNQLTTPPKNDYTNEEWYKTADAIFNARMADYQSYGQPGGYQSYLVEARKYESNFDPMKTLGYLNDQRVIDSNWEYAQNLGKSIYNGGIGVIRGTLNGIRAARDYNIALLNEQAKAQGFERNPDPDFINALDNAAKADALQPFEVKRSASRVGQFGLDLAEGAGQLAGQMAGSVALNAVLPGVGGMALMVGQIAGGQYEDLKAKGVDTKRAATAAFYNAIAQAPFEYMSLTRLMRKVPAGSVFKKKLKMVLEDMLTEGTTEAIQQFPEEWAELWALNPDKSWKELQAMAAKKFPDTLQNALYAGLIGGVLGAGSRGIHIALDRNIDLALRKELHDERQATVESRINHIKQSGISPDYAGETINANLNNATVLIDGKTLYGYAQRVGEEKAAEKLGVTVEEIREASDKGDTVEVKQGNFEALSASDQSFYQEVKDDVSFDVNDMSNKKYNVIQDNIKRYSDLAEEQKKELKEEVDKIGETLKQAGMPKTVVEAWKALYYRASLRQRPDDPAQWVRDNPLRFEKGFAPQVPSGISFSNNQNDLHLVKDILTANYENPREEVESRLQNVEEQIRQIESGEREAATDNELSTLNNQRNLLRSLLNDVESGEGVAGVPAIEDYKNIYDHEKGTFNVPKPGRYNQTSDPRARNTFSTRVPTAKKEGVEDAFAEEVYANYEALKRTPKTFENDVNALRKIDGLNVPAEDTEQAAEQMIQRMVDNLLFLYDKVSPELRNRAKNWYDGGRRMAEEWSQRYGISPMAAAGTVAVLSPQKDWFTNVSLAERVLDCVYGHLNERWSDAMEKKSDKIVSRTSKSAKVNVPALERAKGKTLKELLDAGDYRAAAIWVRCYDECHNNRAYRVVSPEGGTGDYIRTNEVDKKTGEQKTGTAAWGDYGAIAKAVSIAHNPTATNVFVQLGDKHKVRNFYNNLYAPWRSEFATIDTHAVAAALLTPLAGTSWQVEQNFGGAHGASSSALTGISGTYPIYFEAYRRAAEKAGILPREMQSITWEAVRNMYPPSMKGGSEEQQQIMDLWKQADEKIKKAKTKKTRDKILAETREKLYNIGTNNTGKLNPFAWENTPTNATVGDTYDRSNVKITKFEPGDVSTIGLEVAPDPDNKELTNRWNKLSEEKKAEVSSYIFNMFIPGVLLEYDVTGEAIVQLGGFEGATNPSFALEIQNPQMALRLAKVIGRAFNQNSMMIASSKQIEGTNETGVVSLKIPDGWGEPEVKELYDKLWEITDDDGNPAVTGHSTYNGTMDIMNFSNLSDERLAEKIKKVVPNFSVTTSKGYSALVEKKDYGIKEEAQDGTRSDAENGESDTLSRYANNLRRAVAEELERKLTEAEGQTVSETGAGVGRGNGSYSQTGETEGTGQLLGQETPGTGNPGRVEYNQATKTKGSFDPFTGENGEAVIKLFEAADASTVIHETGHYFVEAMWREIAAGRATEQQKADFEKLMKYCGLTMSQWAKLNTEGRRAAHERLAEAFETYIMEDKAPTRELRPVFKRFAEWLKGIYSAISRNRNAVPLTDEVREVFDRMLASEEDVEEMRRVEGYFEKLPAVITDNLSDATKKRIEDYILKAQDKAVEILTKERLANFSEDRKREIENFRNIISDEVRQEVANRPLYVAARQAQELLGGEKPASAKQYANLYLEEKMSDENEVKWEIVAEQNNMSPSELAQKLLEEPSENEAYEAAMKAAVQKEFPDYYTDRAQSEEATRQAMYNDESGILLGVEQVLVTDFANRAYGRQVVEETKNKIKKEEREKAKAQQPKVEMPKRSAEETRKLAMAKRQQAKVAAQKELAKMKLKDAINVNKFMRAERNCAVKSAEAMAKKDYETARHYKDMQAFNHAMVIESANLAKRKQQYDKFLRRLAKSTPKKWFSEQHWNQAMALFARMGIQNRDYDPTTRTESLKDYLAEMADWYYAFGDIPGWLADETWPITDPKNMTFDDYEKVVFLMEYIKTMDKAEKADNFFDSKATYDEWKGQAIDNLNKLATKFAPVLGERQVATWMQRFKAGYQTLDNFLERMDGWHFGFFSRSFGDSIKHANDNEYNHIEAYEKRKAEIEQAWCLDDKTLAEKAQDVYYEELGTSASKFVLTKMLMNLGNEGNARKLCSSYPSEALRNSSLWVFENGMLTRDEAIAQTKENLLEFLGRVLTKEDIAYAQAKIDLAGMYWGEMAELDRRTKGFTPKKVEAFPVTLTLANGEQIVFRGGYFPLIRNGEMGSHPAGVMPVSDTDPKQGKNIRTMHTDTGHTKARVEAVYPVDLTEGSEDRAMRAAIHDLCWRETMTGFRRILNDQSMFGLMKSKLGIAQMSAFREMLEQAAQPNGGQSMAMAEGLLATTAGWLRRKTVNSIVMLNLRINLQNFGNFFLYGNTVEGFGYSDVIGAMGNAMSKGFDGKSFSEMWDFVDQKSAYMRERSTTPDITLAQLREEGKLNKLERSAMEWGAKAMMYTDGLTARPVWMQAYTKKMNAGATEQEAIDFADTVIRRTLGSGRVTDVASLQRGEPIFRLFTAFQGFFNTQFNQWVREYNVDMRLLAEGNTAEAVQRITAFVASKYLAACMFNLLLSLENPFADDDDDEYNNYTTELIHYPMSLIGIYGAVANKVIDQTLGMKSYGYRMSIIQSSVEKMFRTSGKVRKMVEGNFEEGLEGISDLAGMYYGVPAQLNRLFWNAYDIFVNGMDPRLEDLTTRRPKRERNK